MTKISLKNTKKKRGGVPETSKVHAPSGNASSIGTTPAPVAKAEAAASVVSSDCFESKKRSLVWDHFTEYNAIKVVKCKGKPDQTISERRAKCKYCPKGSLGDYVVNSTKNGTGEMNKHIKERCMYYKGRQNVDKKQKTLVGDKIKGNRLKTHIFNPKEVMQACVEMVVVDELPFSFVEKLGFRSFCRVAVPDFTVPCRRTLRRIFLNLYESKRKYLNKSLLKYRVCLTTDTWTSIQKINYMVLTAHFIDKKWVMHKRIINFITIHNHGGSSIGNLIEECLFKWGITKVLTITVDNAAANKCDIEYVRARLNRIKDFQAILDGKHMHVRCAAHICNLIVGTGLKKLNQAVLGIRNAVKFVRFSAHRLDVFKNSIAKENIPCRELVVMDVPTRWNFTYLMLEAALKFKAAFIRMMEDEECYKAYFAEQDEEFDEEGNLIPDLPNDRGKCGPPCDEDWDNAEEFVVFLKVFYEVTVRVSASTHPTVHSTYHDVMVIDAEINKLILEPEMMQGATVVERVMNDMAGDMLKKLNKYFGSKAEVNPFIQLCLILDPRFKLIHLVHLFQIDGKDEVEIDADTKKANKFFMDLYAQYVEPAYIQATVSKANLLRATTSSRATPTGFRSPLIGKWKEMVSSENESRPIHEVDIYLDDDLEPVCENGEQYPILDWGRVNGAKYPVVARIARDVLAIQVSTVASESAFSTGGRVIDNFRSSLTHKSVEGLICLQSWLRGNEVDDNDDDISSIRTTEIYEACEKEHITELGSTAEIGLGCSGVSETVELIEDSDNSENHDTEDKEVEDECSIL